MTYDLRAQRIAEWARGNPQPPVRIEIHPTDRCNLKCRFCWQVTAENQDYSWELPDEKRLSIAPHAGRMGEKEWVLSGGGEPMFLPEVTYPVLQRIKRHGMYNIITTNCILWKDEHLRGLVEWPASIPFSIDCPNARINDGLRGLIQGGQYVTEKNLADIWYGDHLLEVRRQMLANQLGEHCLCCCPSDITQRRRWRRIFEEALENNDEVNVHIKR